ncbi:MAG TPA: hypothetical protein VD763_01650 [Candidatus Saccharimonadales bacterium]|nr:hypothetical protein [Candidatus Saccharimonadales bacterium]
MQGVDAAMMDADAFADVVRRRTDWDGQTPIRLFSGDTGAAPGGFAQQLATNLGVDVSAPTKPVWSQANGTPFVTDIDPVTGGQCGRRTARGSTSLRSSERGIMKQVSVFQPDWIRTADDQRPPLNKERLSEEEAARVGDYLEAGATVMHTTARGVDILNNDGKVVPLTIRTDGEYVWTGPVTYYVQTYAVAPDADFLAHVRARDYQMGEVSAAEVEAAAAVLAPPR